MEDSRTFVVLGMQTGLGVLRMFPEGITDEERARIAVSLDQLFSWEYATMGKAVRTEVGGNRENWTRFVDIPLAPYGKADVERRYANWDDLDADVRALFGSGYRVGISYNEGNHAYVVSLTCRAPGDPNYGCTFTGFAGDWVKAIQVVCFKHFVVTAGVWPVDGAPPPGDVMG